MKQAVDTNLYAASVQDSLIDRGVSAHVRREKGRQLGILLSSIRCRPWWWWTVAERI